MIHTQANAQHQQGRGPLLVFAEDEGGDTNKHTPLLVFAQDGGGDTNKPVSPARFAKLITSKSDS